MIQAKVTKFEASETSRIDEPQFAPAGEGKPGVGVLRHGDLRRRYKQPASHSKMHDPLSIGYKVFFARSNLCFRFDDLGAQLHHDVLSGSMNRLNLPVNQRFRLSCRRGFEGLPMRAEPGFDDAVGADARIYSARYRFHLRQLRHAFNSRRSNQEERRSRLGRAAG
jgi:hypothetical protein